MNCARTLGKTLTATLVARQEQQLARSLAGSTVVRAGATLTVESMDSEARKAVVVDMSGGRQTMTFDQLFGERVVVVQPDVLLERVRAKEVTSAFVGRVLFFKTQRWKVLKVASTDEQGERLVTLEGSNGDMTVRATAELESQGWQLRRRATPTVSQRLSGVFKKLAEQLGVE